MNNINLYDTVIKTVTNYPVKKIFIYLEEFRDAFLKRNLMRYHFNHH